MKKTSLISIMLLISLTFCNQNNTYATHLPAAARAGDLSDKHIKYFGRWDFSNPWAYVSYWGGAYIKVNFTGTSAKIKVVHGTNFFAKIDDGPWISYLNAKDTINLTPVALPNTVHSIIVAQGKDYDYVFNFQGLILDSGAGTISPKVSHTIIEYIGDSITTGYTDAQADVSDYAWIASEILGTEHIQIAYPGINLVSGYKGTGMDAQYFKAQSSKYPSSPDWNFKKYKPKLILINLGTNDNANKIPDSVFQRTYIDFLARIRAKFPKAKIFAMCTFLGLKQAPTLAAVNARNAAGDNKVLYLDTTDWITRGSADYNDGAHPSVSGHLKAGKLLAAVLVPYL